MNVSFVQAYTSRRVRTEPRSSRRELRPPLDPAFTLRTYVHLIDTGLGGADFLDAAVGNSWATQGPQAAANDAPPEAAETAA